MSLFCLSQEEEQIIKICIYSANGLSIFGAIMVLLTYIIIPKLLKNWLMRYLAYLNISNLFFGVTAILVFYYTSINQIEATLFSRIIYLAFYCFTYSSIIWALILAINLYQIVAKHNNNLSKYEPLWLFIGFVIPIIIVLTLKYFELIQFHSNLRVIELEIPVILIAFFSLLTYIKLMRGSTFSLEEEEAKRIIKIILPYPLVTIVASLSACPFYILFSQNECFTLLSGIFWSIRCLQGILDAIVFGFNPTVKQEMRNYFNKNNEMNSTIL